MRAICPMARRPRPVSVLRRLALVLGLGVTMTVGVQAPAVGQRADQTAMSVPRPTLQGGIAGFPQPLAPSDAARLRRIFDLQARGEITAASREVERLDDRRLLGHILADRWLRGHEPTAAEMMGWLTEHGDHPDAAAIHDLLVRRAPPGTALPPAPVQDSLPDNTDVVPEERDPLSRPVTRNAALDRAVRDRARDGNPGGALAAITRARVQPAYAALLRGEVAQIMFQLGRDEDALRIGTEASRAMPQSAFPAFIAGLAAWRLEQPQLAFTL